MIKIYCNAAGSKRMIVNGNSASLKDNNVLSVHSASEFDTLITKNHLVELPITHRSYNLHINASDVHKVSVRVTLFELEKTLPGAWFRGEISRMDGDRRTFPCYFTFAPVRRRRGVYDFIPMANILHLDGSDLSMFPQTYDSFDSIRESELKAVDYMNLGVVGKARQSRKEA